jgi:hypothetical protein
MNVVFDWEQIKCSPNVKSYWIKQFIKPDDNCVDNAVEICCFKKYCVCYINFGTYRNPKDFSNLEDAKKYCDDILLNAGIKTVEDHFKVLL